MTGSRTALAFSTAKNFVLDTLFPIRCLSCEAGKVWLCGRCFSKIELLPLQVCPYCEKNITEKGEICPKCKNSLLSQNQPIYLNSLLIATRYNKQNISKLIHLYKYNYIEDLHIYFGKLLVKTLLQFKSPIPDLIVPVPLHPRRLRMRGFNQSHLLAKYIGQNLLPGMEIPAQDLLTRKKYKTPQMKIKNYSQRLENMKDIFSLKKDSVIKDKRILLVDDVATTGATLMECAKVLKVNGAKIVGAIVIARQETI